jgi:hypothetical protein
MAKRRQALRFPTPYRILVNSQISRSAIGQRIFPRHARRSRILLPFVYYARSFRHRRQMLARQ